MTSPRPRSVRPIWSSSKIDCNSYAKDDLLMRLDFRDPTPAVVDLSPEGGVVATLQESKVDCLSADKVRITPTLLPYPH